MNSSKPNKENQTSVQQQPKQIHTTSTSKPYHHQLSLTQALRMQTMFTQMITPHSSQRTTTDHIAHLSPMSIIVVLPKCNLYR